MTSFLSISFVLVHRESHKLSWFLPVVWKRSNLPLTACDINRDVDFELLQNWEPSWVQKVMQTTNTSIHCIYCATQIFVLFGARSLPGVSLHSSNYFYEATPISTSWGSSPWILSEGSPQAMGKKTPNHFRFNTSLYKTEMSLHVVVWRQKQTNKTPCSLVKHRQENYSCEFWQ